MHLPGRGAGPAEDVLELLGRVRFAQHLVEEEARRTAASPSGRKCRLPIVQPSYDGSSSSKCARGLRPERQRRRVVVEPRPERDHALDPLGVQRRDQHRLPGAHADAHQHGAVHAGCVHHRHRVGDEVEVAVLRRVGGPVGPAVAPRVDGDDAVVLGEVRDLAPSTPGSARTSRSARTAPSVGLVRGRVVEGLVADPQAVAVDVRLLTSGSRARMPSPSPRPVAAALQSTCNRPASASAQRVPTSIHPGCASTGDPDDHDRTEARTRPRRPPSTWTP